MKKILISLVILSWFVLTGCQMVNNSTPSNNINSSSSSVSILSNSWVSSSNLSSISSESSLSSLSNVFDITSCERSENANVKKELLIKLADIKDPVAYKARRSEAVALINDCYDVTIKQEYEVTPWEISTSEWSFKYKIIDTDSVFDKLMFYPVINLYDYEWFMGTEALTYFTTDSIEDISQYYNWIQVQWFKSIPSDSENVFRWTDLDSTNKNITLTITPILTWGAYLNFQYLERQN